MPDLLKTVVPKPRARGTASRLRRVLFVCYHFPPVGGAGVQRPVKFVKYLRHFGWEPTVLVAENPSVPVFDESLCRDIPLGVVIDKARTWEPSYKAKSLGRVTADAAGKRRSVVPGLRRMLGANLRRAARTLLQPDPQVLWIPAAYCAAMRRLDATPHDAIFATAPSYSNLVLATVLKLRTGLPLVLDFRDEWDISQEHWENSGQDRVSRCVQERLQRWVLRNADHIVATTQGSARRLLKRAAEAGSSARATCIYNGYDLADFAEVPAVPQRNSPTDRFRLVYTGTLWNLADVAPLVHAVESLDRQFPHLSGRLEFVLVGRKTEPQLELVDRLQQTACRVESLDYCDHQRALEWMTSADALCLLLSDVEGTERVVPAKLFEYLGLRKPLLAVVPDGETADIVCRFHPESHFVPGDIEGIVQWLRRRLESHPQPATGPDVHAEEFQRENLTSQLGELLDTCVAHKQGGG